MLASKTGTVPAPAMTKVVIYNINIVVIGHRAGKANL